MWSFVLLMVWLIFYGSITAGDKVYKGITNTLDKQVYELLGQYATPGSELRDIDNKFATVLNKEFEEVRSEIREVIGTEPHYEQIKWGYFAKKGYIPTICEFNNIYSIFNSIFSFGYYCDESWEQLSYEERCDAHLKFLKWYDKTLRDNGFPYELFYAVKKDDFAYARDAKPISECESFDRVIAFWKPFARLASHLID